ncbi:hypothetical protein ma873 [Moumouvirus australiensis]|uniref:Uncharacterized protein n=1 Tax=Moumouvirus australiensis TaxID=2109587 RepID=A0A2P1EN21_9VIRU|nr:hypothetical protein QKC55_gp031 [Moumouvirus australiensis]AVL95260.1 hypothetical protein ma873 [Moumouvirus australiensis]QGR54379.1 hypothetical protein [Moumouvirus maliensis]
MPSKNRENKISQKYSGLFPVCYKEFGIAANKKKNIEKFMRLILVYNKFQQAVNTIENINTDADISDIVQNIKNNMSKIKIKISKLKSKI